MVRGRVFHTHIIYYFLLFLWCHAWLYNVKLCFLQMMLVTIYDRWWCWEPSQQKVIDVGVIWELPLRQCYSSQEELDDGKFSLPSNWSVKFWWHLACSPESRAQGELFWLPGWSSSVICPYFFFKQHLNQIQNNFTEMILIITSTKTA